ncbi:MAG: hypothetical protein M3N93_11175 [Acidobacteriota bacterium]|nr:hypothetical protein [Acidobacteriota bacterium]
MTLDTKLANLRHAVRVQTAAGIGDDVVHVPIFANAAGDNVIIPAPNQRVLIMEIFLWNGVGAQTLQLKDGPAQLLTQLTNMQAGAGFFAGFTGNGQPHFRVSQGNSLVLNLSVGQAVDGFVKYKLQQ